MGNEVKKYRIYVGGEFIEPANGEYIETINPASGKKWALIPNCGKEDIDKAVAAAKETFYSKSWKSLSPTKRGRLLRKLADKIEQHAENLAMIETKDNGKIYKEMLGQLKQIPAWYEYYGGLADKLEGKVIPVDRPDTLNYTLREPLGVVAAFTAWNSPLLMVALKLAPAIAAGNTVVIKPSEHASASTLEFAKLFDEVGFPKGTLNVISGYGRTTGDALSRHPDINKVSFTGGPETGKIVAKNGLDNFTKVTLELGGKSPNIVFDDADLDAAEAGVIAGIYAASGQTCVAGSRLYVHEDIKDQFLERLVQRTNQIKLGDPLDPETQMGPAANPQQLEKIQSMVETAQQEGGTVLAGGGRPDEEGLKEGLFYKPTIISNVNNTSTIVQEEVFGPVLSVIPFTTEDEVIKMANDSKYGLAAGVWTNDIKRAHKMTKSLEAGTVWVNTYRTVTFNSPFGGYKASGIGRENGMEALYEYTQTKSVWINLSDEIQDPFSLKL
ncbi:aldehyde dehydrogenase [Oceanobacillus sp. J11TS1]|uniref:aldehyde dehydrogenase n=1 Tax=Oceanobacillus sp. J11TS1 TaxID=2807191 RepID=UPI001B00019C|nr:aldehyde dehydrogenase [Oceanobacillus sp. J11TS1]GIO22100.1 aldehyde dehydrogenase [Oceanobacillus sp. J11TS1]